MSRTPELRTTYRARSQEEVNQLRKLAAFHGGVNEALRYLILNSVAGETTKVYLLPAGGRVTVRALEATELLRAGDMLRIDDKDHVVPLCEQFLGRRAAELTGFTVGMVVRRVEQDPTDIGV